MPDKPAETLSRTGLGVAAGLAAVLVLGVIVVSLMLGSDDDPATGATPATTSAPRTGPLAVVAVDAPAAGSPACTSLVGALPGELTNKSDKLKRLEIAEPAPPATAAWAGARGEPVVLRCGLGKPAELTPTAQLREVSAVQWLPVEGAGATTWYTVDRTVFVALTVPAGTGTGPIQEISETVRRAMR